MNHFLFSCPLLTELRAEIILISWKERRWGDTSFLLGGWSDLKKDGELSKGKPNVTAAIRFIKVTGRLTSIEKDEGSNELPLETLEVVEASEKEREGTLLRDEMINFNKRRKLSCQNTPPHKLPAIHPYLSMPISPLHRLLTPGNSPTESRELNEIRRRRDGMGRLTKFDLLGGVAR